MTSVYFEYNKNSYLPEIGAYRRYLAKFANIETADNLEYSGNPNEDFDVVWRFMGLDRSAKYENTVHEYNSLSTGILPKVKNTLKKIYNQKPIRRVFLNANVHADFGFQDDIPFRLRDMGVDTCFFETRNQNIDIQKNYDFVYMGSVSKDRGILNALDLFNGPLQKSTLLVIGNVPAEIAKHYQKRGNIHFTGKVSNIEVPELAVQARIGINMMPLRYPLIHQTSTKLLEYCALGLDIVSTRYPWSDNFAHERGADFLWINEDASNLTEQAIEKFSFKTPDVNDLNWEVVIQKSGVFDFLDLSTKP